MSVRQLLFIFAALVVTALTGGVGAALAFAQSARSVPMSEGSTILASCCPGGACCPDGPCCDTALKTTTSSASCCPDGDCCLDGSCCFASSKYGGPAGCPAAGRRLLRGRGLLLRDEQDDSAEGVVLPGWRLLRGRHMLWVRRQSVSEVRKR